MSGIRSAVLVGLLIVSAAPLISLAQRSDSAQAEALMRSLGERETAILLERMIPEARSKEEAVAADEELLEELLGIEAEEEE